jgi:hypothetical protein
MPAAIIAGVPPDIDRRIRAALDRGEKSFDAWEVRWLRSIGRTPGLSPSQVEPTLRAAADVDGAHILVFSGREKTEEDRVWAQIAPYFRVRWLSHSSLKFIPHSMPRFWAAVDAVLSEELEWNQSVRPVDESACLLLPECCFEAEPTVRHVWRAASEASLERIRLAANAVAKFKSAHWTPHAAPPQAIRKWVDVQGKVFDHRGARHGIAPFPRPWRFSFQVAPGFHFDVTSRDGRGVRVTAHDGAKHVASGADHINVDPHGHVRS